MPSSPASDLPNFADVQAAAKRIAGKAVRTPLLEAPLLNQLLGFRLLIKAECLQRTGSFKFRGAYNRISQLDEDQRQRGVVAFSSGNHAQGVAHAAALLGVRAAIVMPADSPAIKLANTKAYGGEVITYDRWTEDREVVGARVAGERGSVLVKPYDERDIIAGQGTAAMETIEQAQAMGIDLDAFVANASGGGLIAGCALSCSALSPRTQIYCAEPATLNDYARSLDAGERVANDPNARSICDALMAGTPGEMTFAINRRLLAAGVVATDEEVLRAMGVAFHHFKLVIEPGGAAALAAVLNGRLPGKPKTVAVVASGGNVDAAMFREALATLN